MATPPRILLQLDVDDQPSTFDAVVAVDAQVDHLFRHGTVTPQNVIGLVHGAMFTRGGDDLKNTAIFIGGTNVAAAEAVFQAVQSAFFGPVRVSVMLDASGCNTTAAAAVATVQKHLAQKQLEGRDRLAIVLAGTGPVGRRVAQMLARLGVRVVLISRSLDRAEEAVRSVAAKVKDAALEAAAPPDEATLVERFRDAEIVIGCGAAGVSLLSEESLRQLPSLRIAIDLNAVPPAGIGGIEAFDKAKPLPSADAVAYGAIGVGGLKMRTHKAALKRLFEANTHLLDADEIFDLAIANVRRSGSC